LPNGRLQPAAEVNHYSPEVGLWDAVHANFHADFSFGWQRYITRVSSVKRSQWNFVDRVLLEYETREE